MPPGAGAVARYYSDIIDLYVADEADADELAELHMPVRMARTLMLTIDDREALARTVLAAVGRGF
jgi:LPPG:FO 2-phospho-L-lactate transferase